jgi:hypothetical protein
MIAEENLSNISKPNISVSNVSVLLNINKLMTQTVPNFKNYLHSGFYKKKKLNEDQLTQIYIEQANILIRSYDYPFNVGGQYRDITNLSKGFSDIYFYPSEQNVSTTSLFSVEAKRLPSPEKSREKEYVIGNKNNGGIERYKTEKHGKNLNKCGLLGFIEKEDCDHWLKKVNNWILDLTELNTDWKKDEILINKESTENYSTFNSIAYKKNNTFVSLNHLWIVLS